MERNVKHLLLRKTDVFKTSIHSQKNSKKCTGFEEREGTRYFRGNAYIGIIVFSCLSFTKQCLRFLLNSCVWKIKRFYRSSFRHEVGFRDMMKVSLNILTEK